jgi:hypothetical protein
MVSTGTSLARLFRIVRPPAEPRACLVTVAVSRGRLCPRHAINRQKGAKDKFLEKISGMCCGSM